MDMNDAKNFEAQLQELAAAPPPAPRQPSAVQQMMKKKFGVQMPESSVQPAQRDLLSELFGQQSDDVAQLRKAADDYEKQPLPVDMRGLASVVDMWTGGNSAAHIAPTTNPEEKAEMVTKLKALAGQAQRDQTKEQINLITSGEKNDTNMMKAALAAIAGGANSTRQAMNDWRMDTGLEHQLTTEIEQPLQNKMEQFGQIENAMQQGDLQSVMSAIAPFARAVSGEKGVLTDEDIARNLPANIGKTWAEFKAYFSKTPTAQLDPQFGAKLLELTQLARERTANRFRNQIGDKRKRYSAMDSMRRKMQPGESGDLQFKSLEDRLEQMSPTKKAEAKASGKTFTKAQVEAAAKRDGVTYEQAVKKLKDMGHGIKE